MCFPLRETEPTTAPSVLWYTYRSVGWRMKAPKRTKTVEAAALLLDATSNKQLNIVPLNKALFYLDLVCLRDLGRLATEGKYVALDFGPAVSNYPRTLVKRLVKLGIAKEIDVDEYAKPLRLIATPPLELIDEQIQEKAARIASTVEKRSATSLSDYSHRNVGWRIAYEAGQGVVGRAARLIDMRIAMQQICDSDDPWMDEALSPESVEDISEGNLIDWV